jgi:hypothetical protein
MPERLLPSELILNGRVRRRRSFCMTFTKKCTEWIGVAI